MGLIFTYLLTYGGAIVSLYRPFYGLLIYICFAIIKPESLWHWSVTPGNYSRIIAIALLVGWAINGFGGFRFGKSKWIVGSLVAYWLWACVSALFCSNTEVALAFLEAQAKIVLPVVVGATLIETRQQLQQLAWTITGSLGYVAYDLNRSYFDGFNRLQFDGFGGMDNNSFTIGLVTGVGLAFFLGFGSKKMIPKLIAFACAAFMAHAVFFSFSRGGMLSLIFVGIATFWLIPKNPSAFGWLAVGVVLAVMMAGPEVLERFASAFTDAEERDYSAQSRLDMWKICADIIVANPIFGIGPDHFTVNAHLYGLTQGKEAHTLWLQIGAELGVPGVMFLFSFYVITMFGLLRFLKRSRRVAYADPFILHVPRMVVASLVGFMVASQFVSMEGLEIPYYVALLGASALKLNALASLQPRPRTAVVWVPAPSAAQPPQVTVKA